MPVPARHSNAMWAVYAWGFPPRAQSLVKTLSGTSRQSEVQKSLGARQSGTSHGRNSQTGPGPNPTMTFRQQQILREHRADGTGMASDLAPRSVYCVIRPGQLLQSRVCATAAGS
jgi:hypothetical protein